MIRRTKKTKDGKIPRNFVGITMAENCSKIVKSTKEKKEG